MSDTGVPRPRNSKFKNDNTALNKQRRMQNILLTQNTTPTPSREKLSQNRRHVFKSVMGVTSDRAQTHRLCHCPGNTDVCDRQKYDRSSQTKVRNHESSIASFPCHRELCISGGIAEGQDVPLYRPPKMSEGFASGEVEGFRMNRSAHMPFLRSETETRHAYVTAILISATLHSSIIRKVPP